MPISAIEGKKQIKEWVESREDIKTIVDVGPGEGTYYNLLGKDYEWIGVEAFQPYVEEYKLRDKYDKIIVADVNDIDLPEGDLIIFGDVLEHMSKEQAVLLLDRASKYKHVIASVPIGEWPQGAVNDNEYEIHRATWFMRELETDLFKDFDIKFKEGAIGVFIR